MSSRIAYYRDIALNRLLGINVRATVQELRDSYDREIVRDTKIDAELAYLKRRLQVQMEGLRTESDRLPELRDRLAAMRAEPSYDATFADRYPLVSVRIASFNKTEELIDVAIASVLAQSYDRFEIVVVNDGPNASTRAAIAKLGDPRVRYEELALRGDYPEDPRSRWMVAGTAPANRAGELARGAWIAPLDDDDTFTGDHIEKLLALALDNRVELAYGALVQKNLVNGDELRIWSYPPAISQFSFQGALHLRGLECIPYDATSWLFDEPGDWNRIRRMSAAGVTMAATEDTVATMNMTPYTHKVES